jgi:hypothetical protein
MISVHSCYLPIALPRRRFSLSRRHFTPILTSHIFILSTQIAKLGRTPTQPSEIFLIDPSQSTLQIRYRRRSNQGSVHPLGILRRLHPITLSRRSLKAFVLALVRRIRSTSVHGGNARIGRDNPIPPLIQHPLISPVLRLLATAWKSDLRTRPPRVVPSPAGKGFFPTQARVHQQIRRNNEIQTCGRCGH